MVTAIRVRALNKTFPNGRQALQDISLTIESGEMVALIGASGSGKSTLLRHMAGLMTGDRTHAGLIDINGKTVQRQGKVATDIRTTRADIGFVFQQFNLVDRLPVIVNVLVGTLHRLPLWRSLVRWFSAAEVARGVEALRRVGIAECWAQRAKVILADEPIASLDPESSRKVMDILAQVNREDRCTVVVSLHQVNVALKYCARRR